MKGVEQTAKFDKVVKAVEKAGLGESLFEAIQQYSNLNVLYVNETSETITLL
jgi:hypothetical protein